MSDFLEQKRNEIAERLRELEPLVEEYRQLEAAAAALAGVAPAKAPAATQPRAAAAAAAKTRRPKAAARPQATSNGAAKRRGRPRGSGARAQQALQLVGAQPGITIPEIAEAMGIKQNYLYRVLPTLEKEGKVVKKERGWHAAETAAA